MYREPGKLARQLCYQDQALLRIEFSWNNIRREDGKKVDFCLVDLVVQRVHQQELTYLIFKLSSFTSFKLSSLLFKKSRPKNREYKLYTQIIFHLPKVKISTSSGCHHPKRSYSSPKRFSLDPSIKVETPLYSDHLSPSQGEDKYIFRMTPSKKKLLKPKEVFFGPIHQSGNSHC